MHNPTIGIRAGSLFAKMSTFNNQSNLEKIPLLDLPRIVSYRPPSFSYLSYDVWNKDKTSFMITYEDLRDDIIKFGKEGLDEAAMNFFRHCNPTEEQQSSILKLL